MRYVSGKLRSPCCLYSGNCDAEYVGCADDVASAARRELIRRVHILSGDRIFHRNRLYGNWPDKELHFDLLFQGVQSAAPTH